MKAFTCCNCHNKVSWRKALWVTNFSKIRCNHCGFLLKPNIKQLQIISVGFGAFSGPITFLTAYHFFHDHKIWLGILAAFGIGLFMYVLLVSITYKKLNLAPAHLTNSG